MNRLHQIVSASSPVRLPAILRVLLGSVAVVRGLEAHRIMRPFSSADVIRIPYVTWMPEPSGPLVTLLVVVWLTAGLLFTVGYRTRLSGFALTAAMAAGLMIDQQAYSNHLYLLTVMVGLLTLSGPGGAFSIDARWGRGPTHALMWPLVLMKVQITVVYLFAALTKLNSTYISGRVLAGQLGTGLVPFPDGWRVPRVLMWFAVASVVVEIVIAFYLWHPQRRFIGVGAGVLLHVSIVLAMTPFIQLAVFSSLMLASYLLFIPAREPRTVEAPPALGQLVARLDWLKTMTVSPGTALRTQRGAVAHDDWSAAIVIGDELPAVYLAAPFLRLPLVRNLGANWLARRSSELTV